MLRTVTFAKFAEQSGVIPDRRDVQGRRNDRIPLNPAVPNPEAKDAALLTTAPKINPDPKGTAAPIRT
jgi:hypothetical protein